MPQATCNFGVFVTVDVDVYDVDESPTAIVANVSGGLNITEGDIVGTFIASFSVEVRMGMGIDLIRGFCCGVICSAVAPI